jgi:hypothetical protein
MEKDNLEILLEDIRGKFDLVLEGHDSLRQEIRGARQSSDEKHDHTAFLLKTLNDKIDKVTADLSAHRLDTEAHQLYRVKEAP